MQYINERLNLNPDSTIKTNYCKNPQLAKKIYDGIIDELTEGCNIKDFDDHTKLKEFINNWINQYDITFNNMNLVSRSISNTDIIGKKSYEQRIKYDKNFKIKKPTYQIWFFTTDKTIGFKWFDNKKNYFTEIWDEEDW